MWQGASLASRRLRVINDWCKAETSTRAVDVLPAHEREELIRRLLAYRSADDSVYPLLGLGADPIVCGITDASVHHDLYLYGAVD